MKTKPTNPSHSSEGWNPVPINQTQTGFSVIETFLVIVVIGILGYTGWFVWHSKQTADTAYNAASSTNQSKTNAQTKPTSYITISEWGVRAPRSGSLQLTYKIVNDEKRGEVAEFSSKSLTDLYKTCEDHAGTIQRIHMSDLGGQDGPFGAPGNTTKIIGDYGFYYVPEDDYCGGTIPINNQVGGGLPQKFTDEDTKAHDAVKSVVKNLEASGYCSTSPKVSDCLDCQHEIELSATCAKLNSVY